jgi:ABC-type branched-subunit amino acid transport system ATPase component
MVGAHARSSAGFAASALRLPSVGAEERVLRDQAAEIMDYLGSAHADRPAGDLPFAIQKRVELAARWPPDPKLLMLDEPAAGLNHEELHALTELVRDVRDRRGITVLLVEHHMSMVMGLSDHIVALNFGKKIAEGTPEVIQNHPDVIEAYLEPAPMAEAPPRSGLRPPPPHGGPASRIRGACLKVTPWLTADVAGLNAFYGSHAGAARGGLQARARAASPPSWAPTAPARRPRCGRCARWCAPPAASSIDGQEVTGRSTEDVVRMGVAHVPDGRGTFTALSVEENLRWVRHVRKDKAEVAR